MATPAYRPGHPNYIRPDNDALIELAKRPDTPAIDAVAIGLLCIERLSVTATAERLNTTPGAIEQILVRQRRRLRGVKPPRRPSGAQHLGQRVELYHRAAEGDDQDEADALLGPDAAYTSTDLHGRPLAVAVGVENPGRLARQTRAWREDVEGGGTVPSGRGHAAAVGVGGDLGLDLERLRAALVAGDRGRARRMLAELLGEDRADQALAILEREPERLADLLGE